MSELPLGHKYEPYESAWRNRVGCKRCGYAPAAHEPPATVADHPYQPHDCGSDSCAAVYCEVMGCTFAPEAHPPAPPAPTPEEQEPPVTPEEYWDVSTPATPPSPNDRLGEMAALMLGGTCPHTPDHPKNARDCWRCLRSELERVVRESAEECIRTGVRLYPTPEKRSAHDLGFGACVDCKEALLAHWGLSPREEPKP